MAMVMLGESKGGEGTDDIVWPCLGEKRQSVGRVESRESRSRGKIDPPHWEIEEKTFV
jgi:hypothetical protein